MKSGNGRAMIVAGVMSGTSADGVDVALVKITSASGKRQIKLLGHHAVSYPAALRSAVLAAMDAKETSTAELARLNWRLGMAYAEAVRAAVAKHPVKLDLVGCHGQTAYHQAKAAAYAGRQVACTWQLGEPALIAAELRVPVVSNFRPADMAVGGQGAPLVPLLDFVLFAHTGRTRVLQNIGGIGNLTVIPAGGTAADLIAFDTGPGNMVMDALMERFFQKKYDRGGSVAARGHVLDGVVKAVLQEAYFRQRPPKSAGREQFGGAFVTEFVRVCEKAGGGQEDTVMTATALTAESIARAFDKFVRPLTKGTAVDYILSGGGTRNATLIKMLRQRLEPLGCKVVMSDAVGLPSQAKEAAAFALLAWQTWHGQPGNIPAATGAKRSVVLGEICYG
ncbi:MAG TPA: anhydro-N-acetylmuramic acid kinase [Silvibacterium sp.]|nr:anhydro-N-acetylmuramic acid kinase [Silvibacterium sp.]